MTREEFDDGIRRWAGRGSFVGLLGALAAGAWAVSTPNPGGVRDFCLLLVVCTLYGALGGPMLFIKFAPLSDLRASVGLRRSLALMAALFAGIVAVSVAAKFVAGW